MLILSRRAGESVYIGDEIEVIVLGCGGGKVSLGINAPKSVAVHREEVWRRIRAGINVADCNSEAAKHQATHDHLKGISSGRHRLSLSKKSF